MRKSLRHFIIKPYKIIIFTGALAVGSVGDVMGQGHVGPDPGSTWVTERGAPAPSEIRETLFLDNPAMQFTAGTQVGVELALLGGVFTPFVNVGVGKNTRGFKVQERLEHNLQRWMYSQWGQHRNYMHWAHFDKDTITTEKSRMSTNLSFAGGIRIPALFGLTSEIGAEIMTTENMRRIMYTQEIMKIWDLSPRTILQLGIRQGMGREHINQEVTGLRGDIRTIRFEDLRRSYYVLGRKPYESQRKLARRVIDHRLGLKLSHRINQNFTASARVGISTQRVREEARDTRRFFYEPMFRSIYRDVETPIEGMSRQNRAEVSVGLTATLGRREVEWRASRNNRVREVQEEGTGFNHPTLSPRNNSRNR